MSIGQKVEQVADLVYEKGKDAEWNEFWDAYQYNKGEGLSYDNLFSRQSWSDINFKPKYDIIVTNANQMFYNSNVTDLVEILSKRGLNFDTSGSTTMSYAFGFSTITRLPILDIRKATNTTHMCANYANTSVSANRSRLQSIEKIISSKDTVFATNTFLYCEHLTYCIFEGTIAKAFDIHYSTKLSRESILSLLQCLNISVTGITITLPSKCIDTATDTLALIQGDTELNTAYTQALANGYTIAFQ